MEKKVKLRRLENDMQHLSEMFRDMDTIVRTSQNTINELEIDVEKTLLHVENTNKNLEIAIQHNVNKLKINTKISFLCLGVVLTPITIKPLLIFGTLSFFI